MSTSSFKLKEMRRGAVFSQRRQVKDHEDEQRAVFGHIANFRPTLHIARTQPYSLLVALSV